MFFGDFILHYFHFINGNRLMTDCFPEKCRQKIPKKPLIVSILKLQEKSVPF